MAQFVSSEWDGVPRLSDWLASAEPSPLLRQQALEWLSELQSDLPASSLLQPPAGCADPQ